MRTLTFYVSDQTAQALAIDLGRLQKAEKVLVGQLMISEATHPDGCVDKNCEQRKGIEALNGAIEIIHTVMRFQHDVLAAYRYAPAEVE